MATFVKTKALEKILLLKKRLKIIQGGTSAGKTLAILLILINKAQSNKGLLISVVSESFPHLRKGAIRDFLAIMEGHGYYDDARWDRTNFVYTFEGTNSKIEFFSADQPGKVRGPRRNHLFVNECNSISYETYTQLAIRTDGEIYLDFNPVAEFYVHTELIPNQEHDFLVLTYKDNDGLSPQIVKEIESRKDNKYFWRVFGEGLLGETEAMIYTGWKIIDELPHEARLERRGIDFGYTNDPTAIIDIYKYNDGFILDELLYQNGWSNRQIAEFLKEQPRVLTYADSAEPKSIDELKTYGLPVVGATKGPGSVRQGIQFIQDQRISVTKRSLNLIKSYRNYLWKTDRDGKILNEPDHAFSDCMDSARYGFSGMAQVKKQNEDKRRTAPQKPYFRRNFSNQPVQN